MKRLGQDLHLGQIKVTNTNNPKSRFNVSNFIIFQEMISVGDLDKDGKIDFEEFKKLMATI